MISKTFVIAEAGVNHNGSVGMAKSMVDVAVDSGADAVKFQSFRAERVVSRRAPKAEYQLKSTGNAESQLEMLQKLELTESGHDELFSYCQGKKIIFLSTPFEAESLRFLLKRYDMAKIKIASGEVTNAPLLLEMARSGKPVIMSTGMCDLKDIEDALGVLAFGYSGVNSSPNSSEFKKAYAANTSLLAAKVTLLHCVTNYPAAFDETNLRAMETLRRAFGLPVGFSDHSLGISIPIAAVALGASVIEKHFTLDQSLPGPDHQASLNPIELKAMIRGIREVEQALGSPEKKATSSELRNALIARKSLVTSQPISRGNRFSPENLTTKRPGSGVSPMRYWDYLGKESSKGYESDELVEGMDL